jgi:succinyl-CoA synthetase beta subunit
MNLFNKYNVSTPKFILASTPEEAEQAAIQLNAKDFVVKAQVQAGGRGKGTFLNGFRGGVHTALSPTEVKEIASKMLHSSLVTKQTGPEGKPCHHVMVTERLYLRREAYFAILMDRETAGPMLVASPAGGMDIEKVAMDSPQLIFKQSIDINKGIQDSDVKKLAEHMGFSSVQCVNDATKLIKNLYKMFIEMDATLIEINPLAETHDGKSNRTLLKKYF